SSVEGIESHDNDVPARTNAPDMRKRNFVDREHQRHVELWNQVKCGEKFKFESWLGDHKKKFSKTSFTDYIAGRIAHRVSGSKRALIEEAIRCSVESLGPTRTNSD